MKSNYQIVLVPKDEKQPRQKIEFRGTQTQAEKVFFSLTFALVESDYKKVTLWLICKEKSHMTMQHYLHNTTNLKRVTNV